jgi:hypothetical protein
MSDNSISRSYEYLISATLRLNEHMAAGVEWQCAFRPNDLPCTGVWQTRRSYLPETLYYKGGLALNVR